MKYKRLTVIHLNGHITISETKQLPNTREANLVLNRLAELEDKIENGTFVEVLCKVGNKVYQFDDGGKIYENEIKSIHYASNTLFYDCEYFVFDKSVIGEIIFLTKAEAEAKLKELKEE